MNLKQLFTVFFLLLGIGLINTTVIRAELVEGKDYTLLTTPQPTENSHNIEVLEFFWYGCQHCNNLHPHIKNWFTNIPDDVSFRYVPAIFRTSWVPAAKTFYTIEIMGITDKLHDKIYNAIHDDKINLAEESVLFNWIKKQGIDQDKFIHTYNSFTVQNRVAKSTQMSRQYKLSGVPALVVDGKYLTSGKIDGTPQDTIQILEQLIEKVRKERNSK